MINDLLHIYNIINSLGNLQPCHFMYFTIMLILCATEFLVVFR